MNFDLARRKRAFLAMTQPQLAAELGVSERTLSRWENGHLSPTVDEAKAWARAIELPFAELTGDAPPTDPTGPTDPAAEPAEAVS